VAGRVLKDLVSYQGIASAMPQDPPNQMPLQGLDGSELNLMLGVKRDSRDSVHGLTKSLGAEHWVGKIR
jgi:hypothetical protein